MVSAAFVLASAVVRAEELDVDPLSGRIEVVLRKEGLLKALAHDHVVEARDFSGKVSLAGSSASVHLEIDARTLDIDLPDDRVRAGLPDDVSLSDRAKIRESMRGEKGLDVLAFPRIAFDAEGLHPVPGWKGVWTAAGTFSLHGTTRTLSFPVTLGEKEDGYWVSGTATLKPSDYGIKPFSVAGLVKVKDEAEVTFKVALRRPAELFVPEAPVSTAAPDGLPAAP